MMNIIEAARIKEGQLMMRLCRFFGLGNDVEDKLVSLGVIRFLLSCLMLSA